MVKATIRIDVTVIDVVSKMSLKARIKGAFYLIFFPSKLSLKGEDNKCKSK